MDQQALTYLNCDFYRGERPLAETSSFVALNVGREPGCLVLAGSAAVRAGIGSQIACRLCLEHFTDGVLQHYSSAAPNSDEPSLTALEAAFKRANSAVYEFGHKLSAGGRLASAMAALVIDGRHASAGRVGGMSAYLFREEKLYPFFEREETASRAGFLGTNSLVTIETASIEAVGGDLIYLFSRLFSEDEEDLLLELLGGCRPAMNTPSLVHRLLPDPQELEFAIGVSIGPEAIYLSEAQTVGAFE